MCMRYYNKRSDVKLGRAVGEGVAAVPLREIEVRLSEELRSHHGEGKVNSIIQKVKERSININKDNVTKTIIVHSAPLVWRDVFRDMFPEYRVSFEP